MKGWLTGWKAISKYVGRSIKTTKKYHNRYSMPVHSGPGGAPMAIPSELDLWLIAFSERRKKMKIAPKYAQNLPKTTRD